MRRENQNVDLEIAYVVRHEGLSSVFASQVLDRLHSLAGFGLPARVFVLTPIGQFVRKRLREQWNICLRHFQNSQALQVHRIPTMPSRFKSTRLDRIVLSYTIKAALRALDAPPPVFHGRNASATCLLLEIRERIRPRFPVVYDCRGLEDVEAQYLADSANPEIDRDVQSLSVLMKRAAQQSDGVLCVSHEMKRYLIDRFGVPTERVMVIPCCVNYDAFEVASQKRGDIRARLNISDSLVITYCGGIQKWQLPRDTIELFKIALTVEPTSHMLVITTSPDRFRNLLLEMAVPLNRTTVLSVPHHEVADYLAAGDIGVLLREQSDVNKVASPVKFGEYMAAGLPVAISSAVGDYSKAVEENGLGIVVDVPLDPQAVMCRLAQFISECKRSREAIRLRCQSYARTFLRVQEYISDYIAFLQRTRAHLRQNAAS